VIQSHTSRSDERGQILVMVATGLLTLIAFIGVIIDGGNAWAQQRGMQNGVDAVAEAGAVVLAQRLSGASRTDADVSAALANFGTKNDIQVSTAYYTDHLGTMLTPSGATTTNTSAAARVGDGSIPAGTQGVRALGRRTFETFIARMIGFPQLTTSSEATAVTGPPRSICAAIDGCALLPVAFPVNQIQCDGSDRVQYKAPIQPYVAGTRYIFPLCFNAPGNVGWLDWVPPAGGASEVAASTTTPNNPAVNLPSWVGIDQTGNISSSQVETALNGYIGVTVTMPMFDSTCDMEPSEGGLIANCPTGHVGGNGSNQWYHIPKVMNLTIERAYINGNYSQCAPAGAKSCIIGTIVSFTDEGSVGQAIGTVVYDDLRVQLIK